MIFCHEKSNSSQDNSTIQPTSHFSQASFWQAFQKTVKSSKGQEFSIHFSVILRSHQTPCTQDFTHPNCIHPCHLHLILLSKHPMKLPCLNVATPFSCHVKPCQLHPSNQDSVMCSHSQNTSLLAIFKFLSKTPMNLAWPCIDTTSIPPFFLSLENIQQQHSRQKTNRASFIQTHLLAFSNLLSKLKTKSIHPTVEACFPHPKTNPSHLHLQKSFQTSKKELKPGPAISLSISSWKTTSCSHQTRTSFIF